MAKTESRAMHAGLDATSLEVIDDGELERRLYGGPKTRAARRARCRIPCGRTRAKRATEATPVPPWETPSTAERDELQELRKRVKRLEMKFET